MKKILLIEDSPDIGDLLRHALPNYLVQQSATMCQGEELLKETAFDLILIDVVLPDGDGFDLCLRLSQDPRYLAIPKVLLTGKSEPENKVYGFTCGADDYVTKPFHLPELRARVDRYLNRNTDTASKDIRYYCFIFSPTFQKCHAIEDGKKRDLDLTPTEFRLFLTLVQNEGESLTRAFLERAIWQSHGTIIQTRGIDTHIAHLRKKLGPLSSLVISVYGQGYAFIYSAAKPS